MFNNIFDKLLKTDKKGMVLIIGFMLLLVVVSIVRSIQPGEPIESPFRKVTQPVEEPQAPILPPTEAEFESAYPNDPDDFYTDQSGDRVSVYSSGQLNETVYAPRIGLDTKLATSNVAQLQKDLPIYIRDYETSSGIKTVINIYRMEDDPSYALRVEVYNINMNDKDKDPFTNPHALAFRDSVIHAKDRIRALGIDPLQLYYMFGVREYQQTTGEIWARAFGLFQ